MSHISISRVTSDYKGLGFYLNTNWRGQISSTGTGTPGAAPAPAQQRRAQAHRVSPNPALTSPPLPQGGATPAPPSTVPDQTVVLFRPRVFFRQYWNCSKLDKI